MPNNLDCKLMPNNLDCCAIVFAPKTQSNETAYLIAKVLFLCLIKENENVPSFLSK